MQQYNCPYCGEDHQLPKLLSQRPVHLQDYEESWEDCGRPLSPLLPPLQEAAIHYRSIATWTTHHLRSFYPEAS